MTRSKSELGTATRLEVLQAEQLVAQAEAALPAYEVGLDQSVNRLATLTAGRTADITRQMRIGGGSSKGWGFGPQILLPLFTCGANRARLSAAEARAEKVRLAWHGSVLNAIEEVENALAGYNRDGRAVAAQTRLVKNARGTVELTRYSHDQGQADFFLVLDAERNLLSYRQGLAEALRQQALHFIALSAAAAGGVGVAVT